MWGTMKSLVKNSSSILLAFVLGIGAAACGSDSAGDPAGAYLTIQGDTKLFLEPGFQRELSVKYHDANGDALTGEVDFEIIGNAKGATLNRSSSATTVAGTASSKVSLGESETIFRVKASADFAKSVEWTVTVNELAAATFDIRGKYELDSQFDVINGLPGGVGKVANAFADMTDGPNDPATWLLDQMIDSDNVALEIFRPILEPLLNELLLSEAPDFVDDLLAVGNRYGQISREFGIISTMEISGDKIESSNMKAVHRIKAFDFEIDNKTYIYTMRELGGDVETVDGISVSFDRDQHAVSFGEHTVPLRYGGFLSMAVDDVIVPLVDPNADSLRELFLNDVDCVAVGKGIAEEVIGTDDGWTKTCRIILEGGASAILKQIREIDEKEQVNMIITGEATLRDRSGNGKADKLTKGQWKGSMEYSGDRGELASEANPFTGARM